MIPGIAYQIPGIDSYTKINVYNNESQEVACLQAFFSNGNSVAQTGVEWTIVVVSGMGLLLSTFCNSFCNSTVASHISSNIMSVFLFFQSFVVVAMQHVHTVPLITSS